MPYCRNCGTGLTEDAAYCPRCGAPVKTIAKLVLASWGERFVAWLIDMIILGIVLTPITFLLSWIAWPGYVWMPYAPQWVPFADLGWRNLVYFIYWTFMDGTYGQSIGKMAMKIKVARPNGEPVELMNAVVESLGKAFLLPLDCIIGWILYPAKKQRLFNYISDTVTVKTSR